MKLLMPISPSLCQQENSNGDNNGFTSPPPQISPDTKKSPRGLLLIIPVIALLAAGLWFSLSDSPPPQSTPREPLVTLVDENLNHEPIQPIPLRVNVDRAKAVLGEILFHDPRLSKDNTISCASCHRLSINGADNRPMSRGVNDEQGVINAPTVFNAVNNISFFWDGRAASLEEQIDGPVTNPVEMAANWPEIIKKLNLDNDFRTHFQQVYADGLSASNIKDAIAEFERSLITPNAPFDQFLRGDKEAISEQAQHGYQLFKNYGCIACHQGMNVGGNMYQIFGVMGDYFKDRGNITPADYGRFNLTGKEEDRYHFRVPSLRNVAITAPYFHDGTARTLEDAVKVMAKYQLGRTIPQQDVDAIIAFLSTLTGEYRGNPL